MRKKTTNPKEEYEFLHLEVVDFSISTDASISPEVRDKHNRYDDAKVYSFYSDASINCRLIWPEDRPDWDYRIHIY